MMPTANRTGTRALLVDGTMTGDAVSHHLVREGFELHRAATADSALAAAAVVDPDIVILSSGRRGLDGVELCRRLRHFSDCYVLMVSVDADELDVLTGLSAGADGFMNAPVHLPELVARVGAITRRPRALCAPATARCRPALTVGAMSVRPSAREVWLGEALVVLTRTEFDLLVTLADHPLVTFTRRALVQAVWGEAAARNEHVVDVHVGHIRHKLGDTVDAQRFIRTVRGLGYRIGSGE